MKLHVNSNVERIPRALREGHCCPQSGQEAYLRIFYNCFICYKNLNICKNTFLANKCLKNKVSVTYSHKYARTVWDSNALPLWVGHHNVYFQIDFPHYLATIPKSLKVQLVSIKTSVINFFFIICSWPQIPSGISTGCSSNGRSERKTKPDKS